MRVCAYNSFEPTSTATTCLIAISVYFRTKSEVIVSVAAAATATVECNVRRKSHKYINGQHKSKDHRNDTVTTKITKLRMSLVSCRCCCYCSLAGLLRIFEHMKSSCIALSLAAVVFCEH